MAKMKKTLNCGCVVGLDYDGTLAVVYCPKHKAAPELYEALMYLNENTGESHYTPYAREKCRKALAKAEGK